MVKPRFSQAASAAENSRQSGDQCGKEKADARETFHDLFSGWENSGVESESEQALSALVKSREIVRASLSCQRVPNLRNRDQAARDGIVGESGFSEIFHGVGKK